MLSKSVSFISPSTKYKKRVYMLKLVPKLKTSKSLKLLLVDMKANSSMSMRLEMSGMAQNMQKCFFFIVVPRFRVKNQIS